MRSQKILVHLEPRDRARFIAGDLIDPEEVDLLDLRGEWDSALEDFVGQLPAHIEPFLYLQVFTKPDLAWARPLPKPFDTMDQLPTIPLVQAWAYNRPAIDWPNISIAPFLAALEADRPPDSVGYFGDNYFAELAPWMFLQERWDQVPSLGEMKRNAYRSRVESLVDRPDGLRWILNGRPTFVPPGSFWMIERAKTRPLEVARGLSEVPGQTILSIPAEESWNWNWIFENWIYSTGSGISFTSDSQLGLQSPASIAAYKMAVERRKKGVL